MLDPTGRTFTVQPSQVTAIKDHGFGLGRTRADIVDKVRIRRLLALLFSASAHFPTPGCDAVACGFMRGDGTRHSRTCALCGSHVSAWICTALVCRSCCAQVKGKATNKSVTFDPRFVPKVRTGRRSRGGGGQGVSPAARAFMPCT